MWALQDPTAAGIDVTEITALNYSFVYACVGIISGAFSMLPGHVYRRESESNRSLANDHPAWNIISGSPDGEMLAITHRETSTAHALLRGNGVSELVRNKRGQAINGYLLDPRRVNYERNDQRQRIYKVSDNTKDISLTEYDVLHIPALSWDGWVGKSPIALARESIGLGLVTEQYGAQFFGKGGRPVGYLTKPGMVPKPQRDQYREEWYEMVGGVSNWHQVGFLSGGLEWKGIGVAPDEAQFLQTRQFQGSEMCRWFRVPPFMLALMEGAKYDNIEAMLIYFLTFTMLPWIIKWEQEYNRKLFTRVEQNIYYVEFDYNLLLRADSKSRYEAIERQIRNAMLSPDEARALDNRNAWPDKIGSKPLIMASQLATLEDVYNGVLTTGSPMKAGDPNKEGKTPKNIKDLILGAVLQLSPEGRAEVANILDMLRGKTPEQVAKQIEQEG